MSDSFGPTLRRFRQARALTQEDLAERSGLTVNGISALERGVRRRPYPHTVRTLADALALDPAERAALLATVPARAPVPAATGAPLIGRRDEIETLAALLADRRLVTLTGPGGVGKTTLALAVAARTADAFAHGHAVVELAALRDPADVLPAVARGLGVAEGPAAADPRAALGAFLAGRRLLLVLDNLEHLLPAAALAVAALLECGPDLTILATSRSPVRIRAEYEVVVDPLDVPDPWGCADPDAVAGAPAAAMLLDRAAAMGAPLPLTSANAATVAAICWRLDGLPLALELAAARLRLLDPATLLDRLDEAMSGGAPRDLPERQQSVHDTVAWSYDLLDPPQQRLFTALGVFRGPFTVPAAEAVAGVDGLGALVEQSLVVRAPAGPDGRARLRLLEPIRQYARQRLAAAPDAAAIADRHAEHYRIRAAQSAAALRGPDLGAHLDALEADHADLGAAAEHLLATGRPGEAATMMWHLWLYLALRGHAAEGLARLAGDGAHALAAGAALAYVLGELDRARAGFAAAVEAAAALGDADLLAEAGALAALADVFVGDAPAARRFLALAGEAPAADGWTRTLLLAADGQAAILDGAPDAADRLAAAEAQARATGNPFATALVLNMRATAAEADGDERATARLLAESVALSVGARIRWTLAYTLPALAGLAARLGEPETAARLLGAAEAHTGARVRPAGPGAAPVGPGAGRVPASRRGTAGDLDAVRDRLGAAGFRAAFEAGRLLRLEEVAALGERLSRAASG